jgi:hypothetical protein
MSSRNPTKSAQQSPCRTEVNCRPRAPLPNPSEETFLPPGGFLTELDPPIRLLTLPNFGVNSTSPKLGPPAPVSSRQDAGESEVKKCANTKEKREQASNLTKNTHLDNPPQGTPMDPQRLVQRVVDRGSVVTKLLPQSLFVLGFIEVGRRRAAAAKPRSGCATAASGARKIVRDTKALVPWAERAASRSHPPTSPVRARGLTQARFPIGPTRGVGHRRR